MGDSLFAPVLINNSFLVFFFFGGEQNGCEILKDLIVCYVVAVKNDTGNRLGAAGFWDG